MTQAREAFRVGAALAKQEQWVDALAAFERSAALHPHPITTYNMGFAERALGHATRARKLLKRALAESSPGAKLPTDLADGARGYLVELERRVARIQLTVDDDAGRLSIDGRPLEIEPGPVAVAGTREPGPPEAPPARSFAVLVDPGVHVFVLESPGVPEIVASRTFTAGASGTLLLGKNSERQWAADRERAAARRRANTWATVTFGLGAAGLVVGGIFGAAALREKHALDVACHEPGSCPGSSQPTIDAMNRYATGSTVSVVLGGLAAGAGIVILATRPAATAPREATVGPWIGAGTLGLAGTF